MCTIRRTASPKLWVPAWARTWAICSVVNGTKRRARGSFRLTVGHPIVVTELPLFAQATGPYGPPGTALQDPSKWPSKPPIFLSMAPC